MGDGTKEEIQQQLTVGVGTLAGSTIMLLTVPWALGVYLNRRELDPRTGKAGQIRNPETGKQEPKLCTSFSLTTNVATVLENTPRTAQIMMLTLVTYLIIQIPAFIFGGNADGGSAAESPFALAGMIVSGAAFLAYSWYQLYDEDVLENMKKIQQKRAVDNFQTWLRSQALMDGMIGLGGATELIFRKIDNDNSGFIDMNEMVDGLQSLGLVVNENSKSYYFNMIDTDGDGRISLAEFDIFVENNIDPNMTHAFGDAYTTATNSNAVVLEGKLPVRTERMLTTWMESIEQDIILHALDKPTRKAVHTWCNNQDIPLSHYSENVKNQRVLRITKLSNESGVRRDSVWQMPRRLITDTHAPRWANASAKLLKFWDDGRCRFSDLMTVYDKDQDGFLTREETESLLSNFGIDLLGPSFTYQFSKFSHFMDKQRKSSTASRADVDQNRSLDPNLISKAELRDLLADLTIQPTTAGASSGAASSARQRKSVSKNGKSPRSIPMETTNLLGSSSVDLETGYYQSSAFVDDMEGKVHSPDLSASSSGASDSDEVVPYQGHNEHIQTISEKKREAYILLFLGTVMVTVFSDPMVDTINDFAKTVDVNPFYVSFIVTPLASNASEVISALVFAGQKTNTSMALTVSALYGAASMNNTFCLCIFMALVHFRGLAWNYSAECISMFVVTIFVGIMGQKETVNLRDALMVGMMFPFSIFLVWFLENICGMP